MPMIFLLKFSKWSLGALRTHLRLPIASFPVIAFQILLECQRKLTSLLARTLLWPVFPSLLYRQHYLRVSQGINDQGLCNFWYHNDEERIAHQGLAPCEESTKVGEPQCVFAQSLLHRSDRTLYSYNRAISNTHLFFQRDAQRLLSSLAFSPCLRLCPNAVNLQAI